MYTDAALQIEVFRWQKRRKRYVQACQTWQDLNRFKGWVAQVAWGLLCSCKSCLDMTTREFSPCSDTMMTQMLMLTDA
jgi:hypothetical protein